MPDTQYLIEEGGDRSWLLFALDWRVSDRGVRWARGVLNEHPELPTILTTHELIRAAEEGLAHLAEHGQRLWDGLIRGDDQIFGDRWPLLAVRPRHADQ
ncbi:hypothetical protein SAMN04487820_105280 [Actinopolyspora mzabensis]|uniref:Uncharacterized protein n=1 Tax=Actinopolyspora mzabensis TaxID=995066 RepID=A0A1G9A2P9_ACTMZ|nr:hypothetical protein [Actinopolyspora mzabensis]SDK21616.1 hypothetical protein SAMN04487820_105280 [Actinopolyspora mzabensis]